MHKSYDTWSHFYFWDTLKDRLAEPMVPIIEAATSLQANYVPRLYEEVLREKKQ